MSLRSVQLAWIPVFDSTIKLMKGKAHKKKICNKQTCFMLIVIIVFYKTILQIITLKFCYTILITAYKWCAPVQYMRELLRHSARVTET